MCDHRIGAGRGEEERAGTVRRMIFSGSLCLAVFATTLCLCVFAIKGIPAFKTLESGLPRTRGSGVCVSCLFFKDIEPSPFQDSFSVRQQGGLPGPPPRSP